MVKSERFVFSHLSCKKYLILCLESNISDEVPFSIHYILAWNIFCGLFELVHEPERQ